MSLVTTTWLEMRSPVEMRPKRCSDERFWIGEMLWNSRGHDVNHTMGEFSDTPPTGRIK